MVRAVTDEEWATLTQTPFLINGAVRANVFHTGDATEDYNCKGYAMRPNDPDWRDPGKLLEDVAEFVENGFVQVGNDSEDATVLLLGLALPGNQRPHTQVRHIIRKYTDERTAAMKNAVQDLWESKMDENIRVTHRKGDCQTHLMPHVLAAFRDPD